MLKASFSCFKGLSVSAEQKIWQLGCLSWEQFKYLPDGTFSKRKTEHITMEIEQAQTALSVSIPDYFLNRFKGADKIRVLHEFQKQSAVVDIETTGLGVRDSITTIAVLKNGMINVFIKGINLSDFLKTIIDTKLLITYNGNRFDLPFLKKQFSIDLNIPHLDLMPVLCRLGYKGGQKQCEKLAKMKRQYSEGCSGETAVALWKDWKNKKNHEALKKLVIYNAEDVFMLEKLAVRAYNEVMKTYPIRLSVTSTIQKTSLLSDFLKCNVL